MRDEGERRLLIFGFGRHVADYAVSFTSVSITC